MPTTRRQSRAGVTSKEHPVNTKSGRKRSAKNVSENGTKEGLESVNPPKEPVELDREQDEPPQKRQKVEEEEQERIANIYKPGVIERGHIYFFYRPRVQHEEAHSIDEVKNLHILLIPRPPEFVSAVESAEKSTGTKGKPDPEKVEGAELKVLEPGVDAVPAPVQPDKFKQKYRLITIGKKHLPDPEKLADRPGRKEIFWATVTAVGDSLEELHSGLGPRSYETKTRGTRHEGSCRLAGRGAYAIVNTEARTQSQRETHLGYHLSHPSPSEIGDVQKDLGISTASSFVIQVKNPLAPATGLQPTGAKGAEYPNWIMQSVFGAPAPGEGGPARGREKYGLRFASCESIELLDYSKAQLLMIAARPGEEGLEESLKEGRGEALAKVENKESEKTIDHIFEELDVEAEKYPAEPLDGEWI